MPIHFPKHPFVQQRVLALALPVVLLLVACGSDDGSKSADGSIDWSPDTIELGPDAPVKPSLAVKPLAVGVNRVAFGLVDQEGLLVTNAEVNARFYALDDLGEGNVTGSLVDEQSLTAVDLPHDYGDEDADNGDPEGPGAKTTVYVANVNFSRPEWWGAELDITIDGRQLDPVRVPFWVDQDTPEPALGELIPASVQLMLNDTDDITLIDSADPPLPELHDITIADALELGRPLVITFATPAFCQTRFCGPIVEGLVVSLAERYGDQVEFIVIEPFDLSEARQGRLVPMPVMAEWGLDSEPWVFVTDAEGRVAGKFQGITSEDEVSATLDLVLAG